MIAPLATFRSDAFFLEATNGRRFCILHQPANDSAVRGVVVHVHAFAEEMNKCRRMVARAARALAADGWVVLLMDLDGCGDSTGGFEEARWSGWRDDTLFAHRWMTERFGGSVWFWGARAGCLVAAEASTALEGAPGLLLWQPVLSGKNHLTQFLRLKVASDAIGNAEERTSIDTLRARLGQGESLEIAGYLLHPALASGLQEADLALEAQTGRVVWCEVAADADAKPARVSAERIVALQAKGTDVAVIMTVGPPFWQTLDIMECPDLVMATARALAS